MGDRRGDRPRRHSVATTTAATLFGHDCTVYIGAVDVERQALDVWRNTPAGPARWCRCDPGAASLKDAVNEAIARWMTTSPVRTPWARSTHPFPWMVRETRTSSRRSPPQRCARSSRAVIQHHHHVVGSGSTIGTFAVSSIQHAAGVEHRGSQASASSRVARAGAAVRAASRWCTASVRCSCRTGRPGAGSDVDQRH